jgi:nitroimidazol reductase NimA-like FMN-containing flavoprotein (pyridoxamine 5'-phosphate oxidase superfamily)
VELVDEGLEILDDRECLRLLRTVRVGRVALSQGALPVVLPVTFVLVGSDIFFFTGPGLKLTAAEAGESVTFEADEIDVAAERGWSVLAVGPAAVADQIARARVEALGLYPWPAGERHHLVRIRPEFLSGRRLLG